MSNAKPNVRRVIRAARLCDEMGSPGDSLAAIDAMQAEIDRLRKEREDMHGLLLWALWHHLGSSSPVGRPIRQFMGIGPHEALLVGQVHHASAVAARLIDAARLTDAALSEETKWR